MVKLSERDFRQTVAIIKKYVGTALGILDELAREQFEHRSTTGFTVHSCSTTAVN
jgi:hypothetical protein